MRDPPASAVEGNGDPFRPENDWADTPPYVQVHI